MRKLMISLLLMLMLALGGMSQAQDMNMCGNLAEADCAFVTESTAAMSSLSSASFDFSVILSISGTSDGSDGSFIISGDGSFDGDMSAIDPTALAAGGMDAAASLDLVKTLLTSFSGELNLGLAAPEQGLPEGMLNFNLLLVDGVGYLNFESLSMLLGGPETLTAMGLPTAWGGLDLVDVIDQGVAMMGDMSELDSALGTTGDQAAMQAQAMDLATKYLTMERSADEGSNAVFIMSLDFGGMMSDPSFMEMIQSSVEAQGTTVTEEEMAEAMEMMGAMSENITMNVVQKINSDTKFVESTTFDVNIDMTALAMASGSSGSTGVLNISGTFNAADFNSAGTITAPADAPVAKFMDLMTLMGSMGGGF